RARAGWNAVTSPLPSITRRNDVLLQLAIRQRVSRDGEFRFREGHGVAAHLHAAALARRADGEGIRFAQRRQAGPVIVHRRVAEIAVGISGEQAALDLALLQ